MDVLACPWCGQQFVVRSAGVLGGWRCSTCSNELNLSSRNASRISLLGTPVRSDHHLRPLGSALGSGRNEGANRIDA
jgi:tRNA(Ile2) C34 agmatinyltransferase TiaS